MGTGTAKLKATAKYMLGKYDKKEVDEAIKRFTDIKGGPQYRRLAIDIIYSRSVFKMTPQEYFLYDYPNKSDEERATFVSMYERSRMNRIMNRHDSESRKIFFNKYQTYLRFKPFFKRDVWYSETENALEDFLAFTEKHKRFVVKPVSGKIGQGIYTVDLEAENADPKTFYEEKLAGQDVIIEEFIDQHPGMKRFHPESVNTIRMVTWLGDEEVVKAFAVCRMGVGESFVDNVGAGGIVSIVDTKTGVIISVGKKDSASDAYEVHPDTKEQIKGAQIPCWEEALQFADDLARNVPERRWVGWDLALSTKGWVLVEANHTPAYFGIQMCTGQGIRDIIDSTIGGYTAKLEAEEKAKKA